MKRTKVLYMRVTKDKYELPIFVCDSVKELSQKTGYPTYSIHTMLTRKRKGWARVEIELEEGEDL